jgi:hypothetical protein
VSWLVGLSLVGALGVGIWLGLPRQKDYQSLEEIDERLGERGGSHRRVDRMVTFIDLLSKKQELGSNKRMRPKQRGPFDLR